MEKQIFKTGDRVFVYGLGWVVIEKVAELYVVVCKTYSDKDSFFTIPNELVSFTEYTLDGFSQERPINYDDYIGKWGVFILRGRHIIIGILSEYVSGVDTPFVEKTTEMCFDSFEPLTEEQIKMLELED
ncbi:hypothetical protein CAPN001_11510 [Capnocytophaga stomatis]|uniref:hypothetical protein n=1 Tax=Capnocytophaga stomatis TaxID=1848904 RepID=UPI00195294C4|nr:hypothetical protein [Capnocytophaga stomatis]GIJ96582.1 hypothetical protein CAPN001_11510 [Capnocytophaga stomatis]